MGNEKPGPPSFPGRPTASPIASAPIPTNFSGPVTGPPNFSGRPAAAPNSPYVPFSPFAANVGPNQRFSAPPIPPPAQTMSPFSGPPSGQPMLPPPGVPSAGQQGFQPPPVPFRPQSQLPSMPLAPPPQPQSGNLLAQRGNAPQSSLDSSFSAVRPNMYGYPYRQATPVPPPVQSPAFLARPGGYAAPVPLAAHMNSREQLQHPVGGPPVGGFPDLVEEFRSLSVGSVPGSMDPGFDPKSLPRPLDGDVETESLAVMYPSNCAPKYLRLTTNAIPNSQSLLSRWHLPLGVIVHPLAEAPDGVSNPDYFILNFLKILK